MSERTNDLIRERLNRDVDEFLARGGKIQRVDFTANHEYRQPKRRSRLEQIAYSKRVCQVVGSKS